MRKRIYKVQGEIISPKSLHDYFFRKKFF